MNSTNYVVCLVDSPQRKTLHSDGDANRDAEMMADALAARLDQADAATRRRVVLALRKIKLTPPKK